MPEQAEVIEYFERQAGVMRTETVMGDASIRWAYLSLSGRCIAPALFGSSLFSRLLGWYFNQPMSRKKIAPTIRDLGIDADEFLRSPEEFTSFNDFFTRRLHPEARPFDDDPQAVLSPADGRLLVYPAVDQATALRVKGVEAPLHELFGRSLEQFDGGSIAVVRLCPADYHRYHFPCAATIADVVDVRGRFDSVNPVALMARPKIFCRNKRRWTLMISPVFGEIIFMEVGAFGVAGIHDTYSSSDARNAGGHAQSAPEQAVDRMQEKGYFDFGGSTIVMVYQKDAIHFDEDIMKHSANGIETLVRVGETIGRASSQQIHRKT
jgi:phosphatidylserine decarboxylase